jgi:predicted deacylase
MRISGLLLAGALVVPFLAGGPVADAAPSHRAAIGSGRATALVRTRIFGHSVKGRDLRAFEVGDPTSPVKVVLIATMHGNEPGPARILLNLRDGAPVKGADIWLVPYYNRDGYARDTRQNARHVDLNRNFPVDWIRQRGHYSSGPRPASEPETRAMMAFLTSIRPTYVVSLHQPLDGVDTSYGKARGLALRLAKGLGLPRKVFSCNSSCHGTMTQWFNKTLPGAALTVEYGAHVSKRQARVTGPRGLLAAVGASR